MTPSRRPGIRGVTILEMMVSIAVLTIVMAVGGVAMARLWTVTGQMRREADELQSVLAAGERWREDIRSATGAILTEAEDGIAVIRIPAKDRREVQWASLPGAVVRRDHPDAPWTTVCRRIRGSTIQLERRGAVAAWRWDLELEPMTKRSRFVRAFTFLAVPSHDRL